ncbi:MAG TPA: hypothetical protein VF021_07990, partial [Longimicrobiales bacterium]
LGAARDTVHADGARVHRITVFITANRTWKLRVLEDGKVIHTERGVRGNDLPVVIDLPWREAAMAPDTTNLVYQLTGD